MLMRWSVSGLIFALAMMTACKREISALQRAQSHVESKEFWPNAPRSKPVAGARQLKYTVENMLGYDFKCDTNLVQSVDVSTHVAASLGFEPGGAPGERRALLRKLDEHIRVSPQSELKVSIKDEELSLDVGDGVLQLKRGDDSEISVGELGSFDMETVLDQPLLTFSLTGGADSSTLMSPNLKHPLNELVTNFLLNNLMLFPHLPAQPISVGHKWTAKGKIAVGTELTLLDVSSTFEYVGDADCPSGGASCALLKLTVASERVAMENGGRSGFVTYGFAGRLYFDAEKGIVDESRVRMEADIEFKGTIMQMRGSFSVRPTT